MPHFKIVFAKNHIISCTKTDQKLARDTPFHFEHDKGQVIHAIVKAPSIEKAKSIASEIINDIKKQRNNGPL